MAGASVPDPDGHVAVWVGASTWNGSRWIQAGIMRHHDGPAELYVETNRPGAYRLHPLEAARAGACVTVSVQLSGGRYRVTIDGRREPWALRVPAARVVATGEMFARGSSYQGSVSPG